MLGYAGGTGTRASSSETFPPKRIGPGPPLLTKKSVTAVVPLNISNKAFVINDSMPESCSNETSHRPWESIYGTHHETMAYCDHQCGYSSQCGHALQFDGHVLLQVAGVIAQPTRLHLHSLTPEGCQFTPEPMRTTPISVCPVTRLNRERLSPAYPPL